MSLRKIKYSSTIIIICALLAIGFFVKIDNSVYGDEGGGGGSGGVVATCKNNAKTSLCGKPAGSAGGGASWRIFKSDNGKGLDDWTGYGGNILTASYKNEAMKKCKDEGWFASYGWDGMVGSHYGYANYNFQIGPANRKTGQIIRKATYNSYGAKGVLESYSNNTKITSSAALSWYKKIHPEATSIPDSVGYFCVTPTPKYTLTAYAAVDGTYNASTGTRTYIKPDGSTTSDKSKAYSKATTVEKGKNASVTISKSDFNPSNYRWDHWGSSCSKPDGRTCTEEKISSNKSVYVYYKRISTFQSKSTASGSGASADTGWTQEKTVNTYTNNSCSPITGCNVTINHSLKRTAGDGSTTYKIIRDSNLTTSDDMNKGINGGTIVKSGTVFNKSSGEVLSTTHKLYPGMYICEIINFKPDDNSGTTETAYSKVCVGAKGNAQPNDPDPPQPEGTPNSGNSAFLSTRVKNTKVTKYNKYLATVYAKPGDSVIYRTVYNPVLQYTHNLTPTHIQFNGGTKTKNDSTPKSKLGKLFNDKKPSSLSNWNNAFKVERSTDNFSSSTPIGTTNGVHQRNGGIYTIKIVPDEYNKNNGIRQQDVGSAIKERSNTYTVAEVKTTPSQVSFNNSTSGDLSVANVSTANKHSIATAIVPYNFINSTKVEKKGDEPYLFAGETGTFDITITVSPKENSLTTNNPANEKYSTIVRDAKWKIKLYNRESGEVYGETTPTKTQNTMGDVSIGDLNTSGQSPTNGQPAKDVDEHKSLTINIPDLPAGTWICVESSVYPRTSGGDSNTDKNGDGYWKTSKDPACYPIAKKPSLQVWGGNIYSRGNIETNTSVKGNLAGYTDSSSTWIKEGSNQSINTFYTSKHIFGSWGELGIIASGGVTGLASGASTGYSENDNGNLWPSPYSTNPSTGNKNPGGSIETEPIDYCHRSRLSFANSNCSAGVAGSIGTVSSSEQNAKDKENVFNKYVDESKSETGSSVAEFKGNDYYYNKEDITIGNGTTLTVPEDSTEKNTPSIVYSTKNITISSNLEYGGDYEKLEQVPKLIIYAKQNIYIDCRVSRIDALLIADYNVVTCDNLGGEGTIEQKAKDKIDDQMNSNQLRINGAILASKVIANRTYGAATGANSIIPAEIINFDPTLYLWGGNPTIEYDESSEDSDEGSSSNLDVVDITELSPRY